MGRNPVSRKKAAVRFLGSPGSTYVPGTMKYDEPLDRTALAEFFGVKARGLPRVLKAYGIRLVAGKSRWPVVLRALGFAEQSNSERTEELMQSLLTAEGVANRIGLADSSTVYKYAKGRGPKHLGSFPKPIDLSNGDKDARATRWRKAEIDAWINQQPQPKYDRIAPVFGALPGRK